MPDLFLQWQEDFIAKNLTAIAYNAWAVYLSGHRGAVIASTNNPTISIVGETFKSYFVARAELAPLLNAWLNAPDSIILRGHFMNAHILETVDNYDPETEVIFFLESGDRVTFFYLKNLPITPPEAYQSLCQQWE